MTEPASPKEGRKRYVVTEPSSGASPTTDNSDVEDHSDTESHPKSRKRATVSFDSQQSPGETENTPPPKRTKMPRSPIEYSSQPYMRAFPPDTRLSPQSHSQPDPASDVSMTSDKPFSQLLHDI